EAYVRGHARQLLVVQEPVVDQVRERGHRCPAEPAAHPVVDVRRPAPPAKPPALMQVRREDGKPGVVLERGRGRPVSPPLVAVTLAAPDGIVELAPGLERRRAGATARLARELERRRVLARVREERGERL